MARRVSGLGSGSRLPIRGFTQLLRNLPPEVQSKLVSAFSDAENLLGFHQRSVPERQTRRRISGRIEKITLNASQTLLGGFLSWNRVNDPRIQFYELQISDDNVFSDPETFPVLETFFALENIRTLKFARVRAVNADGDVGLFSNTARIRPTVTAPRVETIQFYAAYRNDSEPELFGPHQLRYSGGVTDDPGFYTVMSHQFYADRTIGGVQIWSYISARMRENFEGGQTPWDRVRLLINGITRAEGYYPHSTHVYDVDTFHENDRTPAGQLLTFYSKGGYTAALGPYAVNVPNDLAGVGPNDPFSVVRREAADATFYWTDERNAKLQSRFDEAQLPTFDHDVPAHEANSFEIEEGGKTEWLIFRDFRFNVPAGSTITGIEAKIKRRQLTSLQNTLMVDKGNASTNIPFETTTGLSMSDVLEDSEKGRFLNFNANTDLLQSEAHPNGNPLGFTNGTAFTLTVWLNNGLLTLGSGGSNRESIFGFDDDETSGTTPGNQIFVRREPDPQADRLRIDFKRSGDLNEIHLFDDFFTTANTWIHLAIVWNGTNTLSIYKNGFLFDTSATAGGTFKPNNTYEVEVGNIFGLADKCFRGGMSQIGLFDGQLTAPEIREIAEAAFKADLRHDFGSYESSSRLRHFWLFFPDQGDIRDSAVHLVDNLNNIRSDLNNKAVTTESWPRLSEYFYTNVRQFGFLPLAASEGIPHDNHSAIGYQEYGGEDDLWGASSWTAAQVNDFYFGIALKATNNPLNGFPGHAFVDHAKMTIYLLPESSNHIDVKVQVQAANAFYLEREIFGGLINYIETGEVLADA